METPDFTDVMEYPLNQSTSIASPVHASYMAFTSGRFPLFRFPSGTASAGLFPASRSSLGSLGGFRPNSMEATGYPQGLDQGTEAARYLLLVPRRALLDAGTVGSWAYVCSDETMQAERWREASSCANHASQ